MKKTILILLILISSMIFISCQNDDEIWKIREVHSGISLLMIKESLEDDGYDFDYQTIDFVTDYNTNSINAVYSITVTVTDMFVSQTPNWVAIIIFDSVDDANTYYSAVDTQDTTGLLLYQAGEANTVVVTYTQAAIDTLDALVAP